MNKIELESLYTLHCVSGPISERLQGQLANQFPRGAPKRCTYLTHSAASSPANAPFPQVLWSTYVIYVCGGVFFFFCANWKHISIRVFEEVSGALRCVWGTLFGFWISSAITTRQQLEDSGLECNLDSPTSESTVEKLGKLCGWFRYGLIELTFIGFLGPKKWGGVTCPWGKFALEKRGSV